MSDSVHSFVVVLENDLKNESIESTKNALLHIRGVLSVAPVVADVGSYMAMERARQFYATKLLELMRQQSAGALAFLEGRA